MGICAQTRMACENAHFSFLGSQMGSRCVLMRAWLLQVMIQREKNSGVSITAFFLSKCIVDIMENFWQPLFFLGVCYNWIMPMTTFWDMYLALVCVSFAASGVRASIQGFRVYSLSHAVTLLENYWTILCDVWLLTWIIIITTCGLLQVGILFGVVIKPATMTLAAVLFSLVVGIFLNGTIGLLYSDVKSNGMGMIIIWSASFSRWAQELLVVSELKASMTFGYQKILAQVRAT